MAVIAETRSGPIQGINYRLGALGFTDLSRFGSEFASSGINGILDQITDMTRVERIADRLGTRGVDTSGVVQDPDGEERAAWEGLR